MSLEKPTENIYYDRYEELKGIPPGHHILVVPRDFTTEEMLEKLRIDLAILGIFIHILKGSGPAVGFVGFIAWPQPAERLER